MDIRKLRRLQAKAEGIFREYEAVAVLANIMTAQRRAELESERTYIRQHPTISKMSEFIARREGDLQALRRSLGVIASREDLLQCLKFVEAAPAGKDALFPKYVLRELFKSPGAVFTGFDDFPEHGLIVLHQTKPAYHVSEKTVDWVLPESLIYEDMCALFNLAIEYHTRIATRADKRTAGKFAKALSRAGASTALYFVESYLNGLALDYYHAHKASLDEDEIAALTEWDSRKNRWKPLGLRDKLLQYPRIVLRAPHPPLQESNCPELRYVVNTLKPLRDSVVHASARPDPHTAKPEKINLLLNYEVGELSSIVDNVIALVRRIETVVHGDGRRVSWMLSRCTDGSFPRESFH